jgi:hypothetical protein
MAVARVLLDALNPWAPDARFIDVEIPTGYRRVFAGALRPGDLHLDPATIEAAGDLVPGDTTAAVWLQVQPGKRPAGYPDGAQWYMLVVRRGDPATSPDQPCESCLAIARIFGERYCDYCRGVILARARIDAHGV